jgi:hypothetical protein
MNNTHAVVLANARVGRMNASTECLHGHRSIVANNRFCLFLYCAIDSMTCRADAVVTGNRLAATLDDKAAAEEVLTEAFERWATYVLSACISVDNELGVAELCFRQRFAEFLGSRLRGLQTTLKILLLALPHRAAAPMHFL